ncbi:HAD family hydrolase [Myroides sp. WP-1]|uniref:HAD family hydrolase n=1 Tax=Myroides sp. WP-1 TaxID=2759944 RepID=UPI0015F96468|nr:HAD family hydrolase [Myroides sp. WP-1]MBB1140431.1 HAD family hydrolase [Myroides sp. WP-1]
MRLQNKITTIAFDADDTLWVNEPYFQEAEQQFVHFLQDYNTPTQLSKELYQTEMKNLPLYGFGIKGFVLCMIETAQRVSQHQVSPLIISKIIDLGQDLLQQPIELLEGVQQTLDALHGKYNLILATKGDLLDQQRKIKNSALGDYFNHIEIMSDKQTADYQRLLHRLACVPEQFFMVGNSMKSDILPVLDLEGHAAFIPYAVTWSHEQQEAPVQHDKLITLQTFDELLLFL